ncbi:MAG: FkbM family methyltransferase, partial [archaeon]|nr:FkbM family methyltransferase [archaeon]
LPAKVKNYNIGLADETGEIDFFYYPKVCADSAAVQFDWEYKVNKYVENYKEAICKNMPIARIVPKFLRKFVVRTALKRIYSGEKVICKLRTLSDIIKENDIKKIDLLKLDAENYEKQVLAGIKEDDWDKIQQLAIEVHTHITGGRNLLKEIIELLESKKFKTEVGEESRESIMGVYMLYAKRD